MPGKSEFRSTKVVHVDERKKVLLRGIAPGRIIRTRDGRYGVVSGIHTYGKFVACDFWDGGLELIPADQYVRVLPRAEVL